MVKKTIQVALRIRPTDAAAADHLSTPTSKVSNKTATELGGYFMAEAREYV